VQLVMGRFWFCVFVAANEIKPCEAGWGGGAC
jgi:hypothetical protein